MFSISWKPSNRIDFEIHFFESSDLEESKYWLKMKDQRLIYFDVDNNVVVHSYHVFSNGKLGEKII